MSDFTLSTLQREHREWSARNFGPQPPYQPLLGVVEEVGELAHAQLKHEQGIRRLTADDAFLPLAKDAVGDIIVYLTGYCSALGIDIHEAVLETWSTVKARDWKASPDDAGGVSAQATSRAGD